jgi:hypothetical protein
MSDVASVISPSKSPHRAVLVFTGNTTKWPSLSPEEKQISSIQMLVISTATRYAMERYKYPHAIVSKMVVDAVSGCEST